MILGNSAFTDESQQEIASTEQTFINKLVQDKKDKEEKPQNQLLIVQTSYANQLVYGASKDINGFLYPETNYPFNPNAPIFSGQKKLNKITTDFEFVKNYSLSYNCSIIARYNGLSVTITPYTIKMYLCFVSSKVNFLGYGGVAGTEYRALFQIYLGDIKVNGSGDVIQNQITKSSTILKILENLPSSLLNNEKLTINNEEKKELEQNPNIAYIVFEYQNANLSPDQKTHLSNTIFDGYFDLTLFYVSQYPTS